jgi:hypothetical protein
MTQNLKEMTKNAINKSNLNNIIQAVFLYGSFATKKEDEYSDIDLLVITNSEIDNIQKDEIENIFLKLFEKEIDISIYDQRNYNKLLDSGSLFLHHIKNEADLLYSKQNKSKDSYFKGLKEFKGISEDILLYSRMLKKTELSIKNNGISFFDLRVLAMLARNTLIVLNYNKYKDKTKFGKFDVYEKIKDEFNEFPLEDYSELLKYRSFYNRDFPKIDLPSESDVNKKVRYINDLIEYSKKSIGIKDNIDRFNFILDDNNTRNFYTSFEIFIDLERDLYMNLKKYIQRNYQTSLTSFNNYTLQSLTKEYRDDRFIASTSKIVKHIEFTKRYSNNYSIEVPNIYKSRQFIQNESLFQKFLINVGRKFNFLDKLFNKLFRNNYKVRKQTTLKEDLEEYIVLRNELLG